MSFGGLLAVAQGFNDAADRVGEPRPDDASACADVLWDWAMKAAK